MRTSNKENHNISTMKFYKYLFSTTAILALLAVSVLAQNNLRIPLSRPGEAGVIKINTTFSDDIIIQTHKDKDVLFIVDGDDEEEESADDSRAGLRRISRSGGGLEVIEKDNVVEVSSSSHDDSDIEIWVPENFSIHLSTTHGDVLVEGVNGEHEISSTNGDIEMYNIRGSVVVNTINGDVEVELVEVNKDAPMSFTTLNGDIEVSFPADVKFYGKMKTEYGDVYVGRNFDIEIDRSTTSTEKKRKDGTYSVVVNKWITGKVNGGGPEYVFKTMHGDIEIRKN